MVLHLDISNVIVGMFCSALVVVEFVRVWNGGKR
jgi:hypothetical protein